MIPEEEKYDLLTRYLTGKLSPKELEDFEVELNSSESLRSDLEIHREIHELTTLHALYAIDAQMSEMDFTQFDKPKSNRGWWIGGFLLFPLIITSILYVVPSDPTIREKTQGNNLTSPKEAKKHSIPEHINPATSLTENNASKNQSSLKKSSDIVNPDITVITIPIIPNDSIIPEQIVEQIEQRKEAVDTTAKEMVVLQKSQPELIEPCAHIKITTPINTSDACITENNGTITIGSPKGGSRPYTFSLNNGIETTVHTFENLEPNTYSITVKDNNQCETIFTANIREKHCTGSTKDYAFNPQTGDTFSYPMPDNSEGDVTIFNSMGSIVFSGFIESGDSWGGTDSHGTALPSDAYSFIIKIYDGPDIQGQVTLLNY